MRFPRPPQRTLIVCLFSVLFVPHEALAQDLWETTLLEYQRVDKTRPKKWTSDDLEQITEKIASKVSTSLSRDRLSQNEINEFVGKFQTENARLAYAWFCVASPFLFARNGTSDSTDFKITSANFQQSAMRRFAKNKSLALAFHRFYVWSSYCDYRIDSNFASIEAIYWSRNWCEKEIAKIDFDNLDSVEHKARFWAVSSELFLSLIATNRMDLAKKCFVLAERPKQLPALFQNWQKWLDSRLIEGFVFDKSTLQWKYSNTNSTMMLAGMLLAATKLKKNWRELVELIYYFGSPSNPIRCLKSGKNVRPFDSWKKIDELPDREYITRAYLNNKIWRVEVKAESKNRKK